MIIHGNRPLTRDHLPSQVLKVAILAEKYAVDYSWYVDTILNLIRIAGDYVSEEVWYRVLQIVTNRDDVQGYAAKTVFEVSSLPLDPSREQLGSRMPPAGAPSRSAPALAELPKGTWDPQLRDLPGRERDTASVQEGWPLHSPCVCVTGSEGCGQS